MSRRTRRVLVTGGAGFIGSHLVGSLLAQGDEVVVLDDLSTGDRRNLERFSGLSVRLVEGSVCDRAILDSLVAGVDAIFHLAAVVGVQLVLRDPLRVLETNVIGTYALLDAAARKHRPVVLASSSEVYGKGQTLPFCETDDRHFGPPTQPRWVYGETKAIDETLALAFHQHRSLPVVVARLFNTVGPRQSGAYGMVLPRFVAAALAGQPLSVYGDGLQTRTFCDVRDTVAALLALADEPRAAGRVFNIGGSREITILELAKTVTTVVAASRPEREVELVAAAPIRFVPYHHAFHPGFEDPRRRVPDTRSLRELTGWAPAIPLEATIAALAEELQCH